MATGGANVGDTELQDNPARNILGGGEPAGCSPSPQQHGGMHAATGYTCRGMHACMLGLREVVAAIGRCHGAVSVFGGAAGGVFVKIPLIHLEVCLVIKLWVEDVHVFLACMQNISHALLLMSLMYSY